MASLIRSISFIKLKQTVTYTSTIALGFILTSGTATAQNSVVHSWVYECAVQETCDANGDCSEGKLKFQLMVALMEGGRAVAARGFAGEFRDFSPSTQTETATWDGSESVNSLLLYDGSRFRWTQIFNSRKPTQFHQGNCSKVR